MDSAVQVYVELVDVYYAHLDKHVQRWVAFEVTTGAAVTMGSKTKEEAEQRVQDIGAELVNKPKEG